MISISFKTFLLEVKRNFKKKNLIIYIRYLMYFCDEFTIIFIAIFFFSFKLFFSRFWSMGEVVTKVKGYKAALKRRLVPPISTCFGNKG